MKIVVCADFLLEGRRKESGVSWGGFSLDSPGVTGRGQVSLKYVGNGALKSECQIT